MVFVETETDMPLYHNLQKEEIKNPLIADLAIARAVKLCYALAKSAGQVFLFDKLLLFFANCSGRGFVTWREYARRNYR